MAEKDISGAAEHHDFTHWHDVLYDVLAMLQGATLVSAEEHGSGNSVCRILDSAIARLDESIDGLDAVQIKEAQRG